MAICSANGCSNRSDRKRKLGVSFHKFPKNYLLREKWIKAMRRLNWEPGVNSFICSEHFSADLLNRTSACGRTELRENAVPTIFSFCQAHLLPPILVEVMPRRCSVLNCTSNSVKMQKDGTQKSFFRFPNDETLIKKWALACHKNIPNLATALVCADHFKEEDYTHDTRASLHQKCLRADVVPSVNLGSGVPKKFTNKSSNKENSHLRKRESVEENFDTSKKTIKKKCTNNAKSKEAVQRKGSELTCVKENVKEPPKKKALLRKISTGSTNHENPKGKAKLNVNKGETVEKSKEPLNKHVSMNDEKGQLKKNIDIVGLKESPKVEACLKRSKDPIHKNGTGNDSEDSIEESKFIARGSDTEKNSTIQIKKLSNSNKNGYQDSNGVMTPKNLNRTRNKENSKQVVKMKNSSRNYNERPKQKIVSECTDGANSKQMRKKEISFEDNGEQSQRISTVRAIKENPLKRKETMKNRISKKNYKKRIRLGKDNSDEEESFYDSEVPIINKVMRDKVTYDSPSEMELNVDLLNYFSYLKETSRNSDHPILFLADK